MRSPPHDEPNRPLSDRELDDLEELIEWKPDELHAEPLDDLALRRLVESVLDRDAQQEKSPTADDGNRSKRGIGALSFAIAATIALGLLAVVLRFAPDTTLFAAKGPGENTGAAVSPRMLGSTGADEGAGIQVGEVLSTGANRTALELRRGVYLLLEPQTEIRLDRADPIEISISVKRGGILASIKPTPNGPRFIVGTQAGTIEVTGTVFAVIADTDQVELRVFRGSVAVRDTSGPAMGVAAGAAVILGKAESTPIDEAANESAREISQALGLLAGDPVSFAQLDPTPLFAPLAKRVASMPPKARSGPDPTPTRRRSSAPEAPSSSAPQTVRGLLLRAQAQRTDRQWAGAAEAYGQLIDSFPASGEARTALVSLGSIQLDHLGRPGLALNRFEGYLTREPGGSLAVEAAWGKARALGRLGRTERERVALTRFLADHPNAFQVGQARQRLAEIEGPAAQSE